MIFVTDDGEGMLVKKQRSGIVFELADHVPNQVDFKMNFGKEEFERFVRHMNVVALEVWPSFKPKEAFSEASDYDIYYCKETDNNGYLRINKKDFGITVERSTPETQELFKFNKSKMQSFIYDLNKKEL